MSLTPDEREACLAAMLRFHERSLSVPTHADLLAAVLPIIERSVWLRAAAVAQQGLDDPLDHHPDSKARPFAQGRNVKAQYLSYRFEAIANGDATE